MTITNESNRIVYAGNGSTKVFSYPYYYADKGHLIVLLVDDDGVETLQVLNADYTLTDPDPLGGTVTMVAAPGATDSLVIYRDVPATQEFNPEEGGALPADVLEASLDKLTCLVQQLKDMVNRSIVLSPATQFSGLRIPDPEATKFLRWNDDGDALVNGGTADQIEMAESYAEIAQNAANNLTCNRYEETVAGSAKATFTLPFAIVPANANIAVIVNGIWQPPSAYTIVDEYTVTLSESVAVGTNVHFISMNIPGLSTISGKMDKPASLVTGNLVQMDASGNGVDAGHSILTLPPRRNLLINGGMELWQRGTTFNSTASGQYLADRWVISRSNAGAVNCSRVTNAVMLGNRYSQYCLGHAVATPDAALAAGDFAIVGQNIEGYDIAGLFNQTITLSFWVYATLPGVYCVSFRNSTPDRSYVAEYTVGQALTWEKKTITLTMPGPSAGTWDVGTGVGLRVNFCIMGGSTYQTTKDAWQTGSFLCTANQINGMGSVANFFIADVQLEKGSVATDFEAIPFADLLKRCQRYYEKSYNVGVAPAALSTTGELALVAPLGGAYYTQIPYKASKRVSATPVIYSPTTGASGNVRDFTLGADVAATAPVAGESSALVTFTAVDQRLYAFHWTCDAEF